MSYKLRILYASSCHERININLFTLFSIFLLSPSFLISANLFSSTLGSTPWLSVMCSENNSVPGIWVSSNEVDESGAYYTEWNKSEREKQISYINPCTWNLEQWYWWTSLQTETQGERTDLWARSRRGPREVSGERGRVFTAPESVETYLVPRGLGLGLCTSLNGLERVGGGGRSRGGSTGKVPANTYCQFMLTHGRNETKIVKQLFFS